MSSSLVLPILLSAAWASGNLPTKGLVNPLGTITSGVLSSSASLSPGASLADGYPVITTTNPLAGGVAPAGADLNGILNYITSFQAWVNAGGAFYFNSTLAAAIGGYPLGATLQLSGGLGEVVSTINGNTQDPNVSMTGWAPYCGAFPAGQVLVGSGTGTVSSTGLTYTSTGGLVVTTASTVITGTAYGENIAVTLTPAGASSAAVNGISVTATYAGATATSNNIFGCMSAAVNAASTGTTPNVYGILSTATHSGTGTTSSLAGLGVTVTKSAGVVTNAYGLYINPITAGSTGNFAIYTNTGVVSINDTTACTSLTSGALVVAGGAGITGSVYVGGSLQVKATGSNLLVYQNQTTSGSVNCAMTPSVGPTGASASIVGWVMINVAGRVSYQPFW